jgi:hypothetical protein
MENVGSKAQIESVNSGSRPDYQIHIPLIWSIW